MMFDFRRMTEEILRVRDFDIFFVGGSVKSGTTWLQVLLDRHPRIRCNGEAHFFDELASRVGSSCVSYNNYIDHLNRTVFPELPGSSTLREDDFLYLVGVAASLLLAQQTEERPGVTAVGEKTPLNVHHLSLADLLFPGCKMVHMVRDGRDCAVSAWFHNLRVSPNWKDGPPLPFAEFAGNFARGWVADLASADFFVRQFPDRSYVVRYEDLLADAPAALGRLCRFLAVDDDPEVMRACCEQASFRALSGGRDNGEERTDSFFRKGTAGDWRRHFDAEADAAFRREAEHWLRDLGYLAADEG
jgi:hypothetical protein